MYGVLLGCIDPILTIAATLSAKNPFISSFENQDEVDAARLKFLEGDSDLITSLNAFSAWKRLSSDGDAEGATVSKSHTGSYRGGGTGGGGGGQALRARQEHFCSMHFLSLYSLQLIDQMRDQFLQLLKDIGFLPPDLTMPKIATSHENRNGSNLNIIKAVLCAGLVPNILQVPKTAKATVFGGLNKKLGEICLQSKRGDVFVHPGCVLADCKSLDSSHLVYVEGVRTSKV